MDREAPKIKVSFENVCMINFHLSMLRAKEVFLLCYTNMGDNCLVNDTPSWLTFEE